MEQEYKALIIGKKGYKKYKVSNLSRVTSYYGDIVRSSIGIKKTLNREYSINDCLLVDSTECVIERIIHDIDNKVTIYYVDAVLEVITDEDTAESINKAKKELQFYEDILPEAKKYFNLKGEEWIYNLLYKIHCYFDELEDTNENKHHAFRVQNTSDDIFSRIISYLRTEPTYMKYHIFLYYSYLVFSDTLKEEFKQPIKEEIIQKVLSKIKKIFIRS